MTNASQQQAPMDVLEWDVPRILGLWPDFHTLLQDCARENVSPPSQLQHHYWIKRGRIPANGLAMLIYLALATGRMSKIEEWLIKT